MLKAGRLLFHGGNTAKQLKESNFADIALQYAAAFGERDLRLCVFHVRGGDVRIGFSAPNSAAWHAAALEEEEWSPDASDRLKAMKDWISKDENLHLLAGQLDFAQLKDAYSPTDAQAYCAALYIISRMRIASRYSIGGIIAGGRNPMVDMFLPMIENPVRPLSPELQDDLLLVTSKKDLKSFRHVYFQIMYKHVTVSSAMVTCKDFLSYTCKHFVESLASSSHMEEELKNVTWTVRMASHRRSAAAGSRMHAIAHHQGIMEAIIMVHYKALLMKPFVEILLD